MRKIAYKQMLKNDVYEDWVGLDTENDWEGMSILHNEIEEKKLWKNAHQSWEKMHLTLKKIDIAKGSTWKLRKKT